MDTSKKPTMYSIAQRFNNIAELLNDEEIPAEQVAAALAGVQSEIAEKADACIAYRAKLETRIAGAKAEAKRLNDYVKWLEKSLDRFDDCMLAAMDLMDTKELMGDRGVMAWKLNPPRLEYVDESKVPVEFLTVVPEQVIPEHFEVNKAALKKEIKERGGHIFNPLGELIAMTTQSRRVVVK